MKAILILDMPECCGKCTIRLKGEPNEWCWVLKHGLDDISKKPNWCPLKPIPDKQEAKWCYGNDYYQRGWNACIEKILGEENE